MKIGETHAGCRFWGYQPASHGGKDRAAAKNEATAIKAAGHKPVAYGLKAKIAAIGAAKRIEMATGIEMAIFNHDYL